MEGLMVRLMNIKVIHLFRCFNLKDSVVRDNMTRLTSVVCGGINASTLAKPVHSAHYLTLKTGKVEFRAQSNVLSKQQKDESFAGETQSTEVNKFKLKITK